MAAPLRGSLLVVLQLAICQLETLRCLLALYVGVVSRRVGVTWLRLSAMAFACSRAQERVEKFCRWA